MADNYRYASTTGNDTTGDGSEGNPWETIGHSVGQILGAQNPLTDNWFLLLNGTVASPAVFDEEVDDKLDFSAVSEDGGALVIRPQIWEPDNYSHGLDPFDSSNPGRLDPAASKPTIVPRCDFGEGQNVVLAGVEIRNLGTAVVSAFLSAAKFPEKNDGTGLVFCTIRGEMNAGVDVQSECSMVVENCHILYCDYGVRVRGSIVALRGENIIEDAAKIGILGTEMATVSILPTTLGGFYATTRIVTTVPREEYDAVRLVSRTQLLLEPPYNGEELFDELQNIRGYLQVLDKSGYAAAEYRGVVLETQSMMTGASRVFFSDPDFNSGVDTVPASRQFLLGTGEACGLAD